MTENAHGRGRIFWTWVLVLSALLGTGCICYLIQLTYGLGITGMSRDVSWGFYIAQFTFLVGVAASAVMVILPYYLHDYKSFGKITILGECLAISAIVMCITFVTVDLGRPDRIFYLILHPSPRSILFWDIVVLSSYLLLNIVIAGTTLFTRRYSLPPPTWVKPLIIISIPVAISIHTVTAFIYNGLPGRSFWLTAIMAPRFLASAFASGPSLLIIVCLILRKYAGFDAGKEAIQKLAQIVAYAMITNIFFFSLEIFTVFYSRIPEHMHHFQYLFAGYEGGSALVPWMWISVIIGLISILLLVNPSTRRKENVLTIACVLVFASIWLDKGLGMITGGFIPSPLGHVTEYSPTAPEVFITLGVWALGFLILTVLCKIGLPYAGATSS